ncbi:MAG: DUF3667 domain-containing protein [Longimicrobiales bacterium]
MRTSFVRVLRDILEDQLSLNGTLPRTLAALFFQPGRLTREYMSMRIASYVPPVRLYLVASVLFFLVLSIVSNLNRPDFLGGLSADSAAIARIDSLREAQRKSAVNNAGSAAVDERFGVFVTDVRPGKWSEDIHINLGNERINQLMRSRFQALGHLQPRQAFATVAASFLRQIPKVMFLLLPVYALLLKLLYIRRKRFFVEHFIFALHVHAFAFLAFLLYIPLREAPLVPVLLLIWIPLYTLLALKQVYGQGWFKTVFKWSALGSAYIVVLSFGVLLGAVLAVLEL